MRKRAVGFAALCLMLAWAGVVSAKLVAHWKLDETAGTTASDASGNGYHGRLMGGVTWVAGEIDGCIEVNGSNGYVDFGNPAGWPDGRKARSLCAWAKTDTISSGWKWIAAYGSPATGQAMFIGLNGSALYGGGYGDDISVANFWQTGVWRHIVLTYDGSTARLYADGVEVISAAKAWNLVLNRAHLGRQINDAAEFWDGMIDDALEERQLAFVDKGGAIVLALRPVQHALARHHEGEAHSLGRHRLLEIGMREAEPHDSLSGMDAQPWLQRRADQAGGRLAQRPLIELAEINDIHGYNLNVRKENCSPCPCQTKIMV